MQEKAILGIDISKDKIDVCLVIGNKVKHKVFHNHHDGYEKLVGWALGHGAKKMHFCMEATGCYMEALANYMHDMGHEVSVVNSIQIKAFTKSELLRGKTDKSDAAAIARFCIANNPDKWHPQPIKERQLRDMYRCLQGLKKQMQNIENKLENKNLYKDAKTAILKVIEAIDREISELEKKMDEHVSSCPDLKEKVDLIIKIKGIKETTAYAIISEMPDVSNFEDARQYAAFAGLTPAHNQSGSSINKKARICKIGSARIRKALYMPALVIKNRNEHFQKFCNNLASKQKAPKVIIVALMRKILHILFGMLKTKQEFNPKFV